MVELVEVDSESKAEVVRNRLWRIALHGWTFAVTCAIVEFLVHHPSFYVRGLKPGGGIQGPLG